MAEMSQFLCRLSTGEGCSLVPLTVRRHVPSLFFPIFAFTVFSKIEKINSIFPTLQKGANGFGFSTKKIFLNQEVSSSPRRWHRDCGRTIQINLLVSFELECEIFITA
jgi:hypothetical protein